MRKLFPGHYTPSEEEFGKIWKDGLIVFDTNVLLDLYRYSENTVKALFEVMESLEDRIWIPFQVSKEYHKNLNSVISDQVRKYESSIKTLTDFKKTN
jgi:predicted nucleic acid-binding protein